MGYFVKDNKSEYKIVIPKDYNASEQQAADELRSYIWQATSGRVRLMIIRDTGLILGSGNYFSIGRTTLLIQSKLNTDYSKLNGDGFVIKIIQDSIITDAMRPRGFLYAVYEFAERYIGVRFFAPDATFVPKSADIILTDLDILSVPAFNMRCYLSAPVFGYGDWLDQPYMAHSRTTHNWFAISSQYGGELLNTYGRHGGTHNAHMYVPAEKYGTKESTGYKGEFLELHEPHPEFYKTEPGHEPDWDGHCYGPIIDYSNGVTEDGKLDVDMKVSVAKVVIEELKKDILEHTEVDYFIVDQEDCMTKVVFDDELLEKYTASGVLIRFFNVVMTELRKWADNELNGRKFYIVFLAYGQTKNAPVIKSADGKYMPIHPTVVPHSDLCIRLAYDSVIYYPYDDLRQPEKIRELGEQWQAIHNRFWFWGYDAVYNDYITYNASITQAYGTVQFLRRLGAEYVHMQSSEGAVNDWQAQWKSYIWSKLLWNPEQDVIQLTIEYFKGYYGKAAEYVLEMVKLFEGRYAEIYAQLPQGDVRYGIYKAVDTTPKNISKELLMSAISLIEKGEAAIKSQPIWAEFKEKYLIRLAAVKATPMWMYLKHFCEFNPDAKPEEKKKLVREFAKVVRYARLRQSREDRHVLDMLAEAYDFKD